MMVNEAPARDRHAETLAATSRDSSCAGVKDLWYSVIAIRHAGWEAYSFRVPRDQRCRLQ